eukprot:5570-Heterococcus_DN1.PRE.3
MMLVCVRRSRASSKIARGARHFDVFRSPDSIALIMMHRMLRRPAAVAHYNSEPASNHGAVENGVAYTIERKDPQKAEGEAKSIVGYLRKLCIFANIVSSLVYLQWRVSDTIFVDPLQHKWLQIGGKQNSLRVLPWLVWAVVYFIAEIFAHPGALDR